MGTALTKTHLLHIAHQEFQLIVGHLGNLVQIVLSGLIVHPDHLDEGQIIHSFSGILRCRSVVLYRVNVTIMIGIR